MKVKVRCSMLVRGGCGDCAKRKCKWSRLQVRLSFARLRGCECVVAAATVKCVIVIMLKEVR
ncbi:hypothetical protein GYH30_016168 [Glycine max]|nr:hypothetical protein GYH30_016168 [Glycine max]